MQYSQPLLNHTFYPIQPSTHQGLLVSNKITTKDSIKLKTQSIQPYQSLQIQNYSHLSKCPHSIQIERKNHLKHSASKLLKNNHNNLPTKLKTQPIQNITTNQPQTNNYPNLLIKRSGSTAPIRTRANSQTNKQNHPNQEQKPTPQNQQKKPFESISSIFHYNNNPKHLKISNLIRFKSKPQMIFCSSKLPKDFFGDSLDEDHHGHEYRFLPVNLKEIHHLTSSKKLKYTASVKCLNKATDVDNIEKLCFNERKTIEKKKTNSKTQPQFTFRKQKSMKLIETLQENTHAHLQKTSAIKRQQAPEKIRIEPLTLSEPRKKQHRKYSRQFLKL